MQTEIIRSSERSTVELVCGEEKFIRRTVCSECAVYNTLKDNPSCFLPQIYSVEISDGKTVVCEEYIDGRSLAHADLSEKEAEDVMIQLCSALEFIHKLGVIHRDIKPSNILLDNSGNIKLIDFEAARFVKEDSEKDTRYLGTEGFAPPEQYGFSQTDFRTDIYAAGQTMKLLLGSFSAKPVYKRIIKRCTSFDPDKRYQSAAELKNALLNIRRKYRYIAAGAVLSASVIAVLIMNVSVRNAGIEEEIIYSGTETASVQRDTTLLTEQSDSTYSSAAETIYSSTETASLQNSTAALTEQSSSYEYTYNSETETETTMVQNNITEVPESSSYDYSTEMYTYYVEPEYMPEYDDNDKIFFCEDKNAKVLLASGRDLFGRFETYIMHTDLDGDDMKEYVTVEIDINNHLVITLTTGKAIDGVHCSIDCYGFFVPYEFGKHRLDDYTLVQLTSFELYGDRVLAVTVGDKKNYNFTGFFTVENDQPQCIGSAWGETYARVYGLSLNEYLSSGGSNLYLYSEGALSPVTAYDYVDYYGLYDDYFSEYEMAEDFWED